MPTLVTMNILSGDLISFVISFIIDTLMNTFYALIWPVLLIEWDATIGIVILVAIYTLYPKVVQEPLENWLFEGEGPPEKDSGDKG